MIDGIKCYSPGVAEDYSDYPGEGFDITDEQGSRSFWVRSRHRLFKFLVRRIAAPGHGTKLLEIGCGTGEFIRELLPGSSLTVTGSEIYLRGLVHARRHLPGVEFVQFDVTQGVIDEQFDMVTAFDVLEHVDDDSAALENIREMLRGGGHFIASVPQHPFLWSRLDEIVRHKRRYTRREFVGKLQAAGFDVVRVTSHVFALFPLMLASRWLDRSATPPRRADSGLASRVSFPPLLNALFDVFMRIDEALIRAGASLPFGGTLVVVASRR